MTEKTDIGTTTDVPRAHKHTDADAPAPDKDIDPDALPTMYDLGLDPDAETLPQRASADVYELLRRGDPTAAREIADVLQAAPDDAGRTVALRRGLIEIELHIPYGIAEGRPDA